LRSQLSRVEEKRLSIAQRLRDGEDVGAVDRAGLEARLKELDGQIMSLYTQVAKADQTVATAASVAGATEPLRTNGPSEEMLAIPIVFTIFVLAPIAIAYARRIWRRPAPVAPAPSRELQDRLDQLAQAVESIAVETERIGEGQRFLTRVMTEQGRQLGPGPAQPVAVPVLRAEPVEQPRRGE
jgi:prefoldin subunit 5